MTYEQHFTSLAGIRFKTDPLAEFTQPQPSVLRIETLPQVGGFQAGFYIDFPSNVIINNISIAITGSSGTFSLNPTDGELFTVIGQSYGVYDPNPPRTVFLDYSGVQSGYITDSILFGVVRYAQSSAIGYIDIDSVVIDYTEIVPPVIIKKGFYRYKIAKADAGKFPVYFLRDGAFVASQCVEFKPFCSGGKILKFMDRNGMYRFYPFNEYWEESFKPDIIGETEYSIDSLRTAQSGTRNIGYENSKELSLVAYDVTASELAILEDLFISMRVYLYIGTTGDAPADWLLVTVTSGNNISRRRRGSLGKIDVTIKLPEQYTVTGL